MGSQRAQYHSRATLTESRIKSNCTGSHSELCDASRVARLAGSLVATAAARLVEIETTNHNGWRIGRCWLAIDQAL